MRKTFTLDECLQSISRCMDNFERDRKRIEGVRSLYPDAVAYYEDEDDFLLCVKTPKVNGLVDSCVLRRIGDIILAEPFLTTEFCRVHSVPMRYPTNICDRSGPTGLTHMAEEMKRDGINQEVIDTIMRNIETYPNLKPKSPAQNQEN